MNATFNINRFARLEKRNLFLSKAQYLYMTIALVGMYILSAMLYILIDNSLSGLIYLAAGTIIIGGPCFFERTRNRHSSIFDFTLPASTFEKFFSVWLKYVIILPVIILLVLLVLNVISSIIPVEELKAHAEQLDWTKYNVKTYFALIFHQSIFMCGYYYFKKYAFAKTSLILIIAGIAIMFLSIAWGHIILESGKNVAFSMSADNENNFTAGYDFGNAIAASHFASDTVLQIASYIISVVVPLGMWLTSFFKLRETEV
ncbi:hypothetical protein [Prevotella sp. 10(H)]|uniref:hypothetical protein n=1 Tax=Prevotella sp. 10(H) TaxID=1158294 RepID=UPI0004A72D44|nr:hypothetical protein [Prevotella sp. 10(H)]